MFTNITFFVEKYGIYKFYLYISGVKHIFNVELKYGIMIKLEETKDSIIYSIGTIGDVVVYKDRIWYELNSYPTIKVSEDENTITYKMADDRTCTIDKSLGLSIKEVIVRYYIMKSIQVDKYRK